MPESSSGSKEALDFPGHPQHEDPRFFESLLRRHTGDASLRIRDITVLKNGSAQSLITELTATSVDTNVGLLRCRLRVDRATGTGPLDVMVKIKAADRETLDVGE